MKKRMNIIMGVIMVTVLSTVSVPLNCFAAEINEPYYEAVAKQTGVPIEQIYDIEKEYGDLQQYFGTTFDAQKEELSLRKSTRGVIQKTDAYYENLSKYTGYSIQTLKDLEQENGDLGNALGLVIDEERINSDVMPVSDGGTNTKKMTSSQYSTMVDKADKGDLLVTKDSWNFGINHGHAALVYEDGAKTIEHTGEGKSQARDFSYWGNRYTMRIYYPTGTTGVARRAGADWANNNLIGWDYSMTASVDSKTDVNCATLVWKAYNSQNIKLPTTIINSVTPLVFVEWGGTTYWAGVNWSGGNYTW